MSAQSPKAINAQTVAAEQAAARRLQWEAAVRHSQLLRDARRHEMRRTVLWLLISAALIFTLPSIIEIWVGSTP